MWKTNIAAVQCDLDSFKEALKSAHQTIKSLREQNKGMVDQIQELSPPPRRLESQRMERIQRVVTQAALDPEEQKEREKARDKDLHRVLKTAKEYVLSHQWMHIGIRLNFVQVSNQIVRCIFMSLNLRLAQQTLIKLGRNAKTS